MTIIPGLTTTVVEAIPQFIEDLGRSNVRTIALFPTAIGPERREPMYRELERIHDLAIPHVHLRTDFDVEEIDYLVERFGAEVFNIHPQASIHPFGALPARYAERIFVENVDVPPDDRDLDESGGICPDYSHLESARHRGMGDYVKTVEAQLRSRRIGCCHVSAIRIGEHNEWNGGPDHHRLAVLSDLDYMANYRSVLPDRWVSLELENPLAEQIEAAVYLSGLLSSRGAGATSSQAAVGRRERGLR